jgi:GT2 family glycosyltransferase
MARVDLIILNWNGRRFLEPCLEAVRAQTYRDFQIWIVDNGSTDGSVAFIQTRYPQARLIVNASNRGFAAANNQAIRAGTAEYVATLNNDTEVEPAWLGALVHAMDTHPRVGMCASKMLFAGNQTIINSAGIVIDRVGIAWDRSGGQRDDSREDKRQFVFGACAGAALYRRAMLDEIGLFDENFFAYLEDVDLAWRAQWAGWQSLYVPQARLYHRHSATAKEGSPFKNHLLGRNKVWLIAKNYPAPHIWAYLPLIVGYDLASVTYAVLARRDLSPLRGRLAGLLGLSRVLSARRTLIRRCSSSAIMRQLAPLDPPWRVLDRYRHIRR